MCKCRFWTHIKSNFVQLRLRTSPSGQGFSVHFKSSDFQLIAPGCGRMATTGDYVSIPVLRRPHRFLLPFASPTESPHGIALASSPRTILWSCYYLVTLLLASDRLSLLKDEHQKMSLFINLVFFWGRRCCYASAKVSLMRISCWPSAAPTILFDEFCVKASKYFKHGLIMIGLSWLVGGFTVNITCFYVSSDLGW